MNVYEEGMETESGRRNHAGCIVTDGEMQEEMKTNVPIQCTRAQLF